MRNLILVLSMFFAYLVALSAMADWSPPDEPAQDIVLDVDGAQDFVDPPENVVATCRNILGQLDAKQRRTVLEKTETVLMTVESAHYYLRL